MPEKLNWSDLHVLLAFGRAGNLHGAAAELRIDETTAARRLKRLERAVGDPLLARDGKKFRLTQIGLLALDRARIMEQTAEELSRSAGKRQNRVSGRARITALMYVFNDLIVPSIPRFAKSHPRIRLEYISSNRNLSLAKGEADIAIRLGSSVSASEVAEKVTDLGLAIYRPLHRFSGTSIDRCLWVAPDESSASLPEYQWIEKHVPTQNIVMRTNSTATNAAVVRAGYACALLPVCIGDSYNDIVRLQPEISVRREIWLVQRSSTEPNSPVGLTAAWLRRLLQDLSPRLAG